MPNVKCKYCRVEFYAKPSHLRMGFGKYCSRDCQYKGLKTGVALDCYTCKAKIYRTKAKLEKSKSKKYFCSKSCQTKWRNSYFSGEKHKNWKTGRGVDYRAIMLHTGKKEVCARCRTRDRRILAVHHVDHNHQNNDVKNLAWLCHNCHHEVHYDRLTAPRDTEKL